MKTHSIRGLLVASAAVLVLAMSSAQAQQKPAPVKLSAPVAKELQAAQKAAAAKDWATAKTAIDAARQVPVRTPADDYQIAQFTLFVDIQSNDLVGATAAAQAAADSAAQPEEDKAKNLKTATQLSLMQKQYDKALTYAHGLAATNPTDKASVEAISEAYYFGKDYPATIAFAQKSVDASLAAHQAPDRNTLEILMSAQVSIKDEAAAEKTLETLVATYNDPKDWGQMIDVTFGTKGLRDIDGVWLGRLLFLSGADVSAQNATMIGSTASHLTFYGDAEIAKQHGGTGFPDPAAAQAKDKA